MCISVPHCIYVSTFSFVSVAVSVSPLLSLAQSLSLLLTRQQDLEGGSPHLLHQLLANGARYTQQENDKKKRELEIST